MSRKIVTLSDINNSEDDGGQAFYAGGSEHSGQQILGPGGRVGGGSGGSDPNRLVEDLFNHASRSASAAQPPSGENSLTITLWRNGFTIGDDNELKEYAENRQFLDSLKRGETPPELVRRAQGNTIDVKLENKAQQDFKPQQKIQAFSGKGHRLGAPTPEETNQNKDK